MDNALQDGLAKRRFFYEARLFTKLTWQKYAVNKCCAEVEEMPTNMLLSGTMM